MPAIASKTRKTGGATAADRPRFVSLEARLTVEQADTLATRLPMIRRMLARGVIFYRDTRDRDDFDAALRKIIASIENAAEPFEVEDRPPRPMPKRRRS